MDLLSTVSRTGTFTAKRYIFYLGKTEYCCFNLSLLFLRFFFGYLPPVMLTCVDNADDPPYSCYTHCHDERQSFSTPASEETSLFSTLPLSSSTHSFTWCQHVHFGIHLNSSVQQITSESYDAFDGVHLTGENLHNRWKPAFKCVCGFEIVNLPLDVVWDISQRTICERHDILKCREQEKQILPVNFVNGGSFVCCLNNFTFNLNNITSQLLDMRLSSD